MSQNEERSNYTDTATINAIAGNDTNGGWDAIDHQLRIIESEFNEMRDGIKARDIGEMRDGIQDLLFTVYGLAWRAGIDADVDFAEVVRSNLTKFDDNEEDALRTQQKYEAIGVHTRCLKVSAENGRVFYVTKSAVDQQGLDGKSYPAGKYLKSVRFEDPQYVPLDPAVEAKLRSDDTADAPVPTPVEAVEA